MHAKVKWNLEARTLLNIRTVGLGPVPCCLSRRVLVGSSRTELGQMS